MKVSKKFLFMKSIITRLLMLSKDP